MSCRVWLAEQMQRALAEVGNLQLRRMSNGGILDRIDVHGAMVSEVVKHVVRLNCGRPALLIPEDEVDPMVQVLGYKLRLERLPLLRHEILWRRCPRWKSHCAHFETVLGGPQRKRIVVAQEAWIVEPLGGQLFHFRQPRCAHAPCSANREEEAICHVETVVLVPHVRCCKRLHAQQEVQHHAQCSAVMRTVQKGRHAILACEGTIARLELAQSIRVECAHRLCQVAERPWIIQIQLLRLVVLQHPWKHRILCDVIVRASRDRVEPHQILEVAHLTPTPLLRPAGQKE
mmetsp:Transcript_18552/g.59066  ORF Transcript_18552/g.59066 Transcript_18552/m.59066 type:complete len:288 (-) Transcript_18552:3653-4516(-)